MYGKFENGTLVQKQPNKEDGFIEIDSAAVCGQILSQDGQIENPPANHAPLAQVTRGREINKPILSSGLLWQIDAVSRDNMRNAIEYSDRNNISTTETRGWVMADNTVEAVTASMLSDVLDAYTVRMGSIYGQYVVWLSGDMSDKFTVLETN